MPKFKVRTGYAYHVDGKKEPLAEGEVIELESIEVGDQKWKLELVEDEKPAKKEEKKEEKKTEKKGLFSKKEEKKEEE